MFHLKYLADGLILSAIQIDLLWLIAKSLLNEAPFLFIRLAQQLTPIVAQMQVPCRVEEPFASVCLAYHRYLQGSSP